MKKIFILFAVAFIGFASCVESKQVMTVTVTNPLGLERAGEMIEVPMSDVVAKLKLADTAQIVVLDIDGQHILARFSLLSSSAYIPSRTGCVVLYFVKRS